MAAAKIYPTVESVTAGLTMIGKVALVTGGYNGLGAQTAQGLLAVGAKVIVAGRNPKRVEHFVKNNQSEDGRLSGVLVDLSDLSTLKQFKEAVGSVTDKVDVLINNAGVMNCPPGLTAQGYELQVGTNAIGTVGVTEALLPLIRSSAAGRIVNVSAYAHQWKPHDVPWNPESIHLNEETYKGFQQYQQSKLAGILHVRAMAAEDPSILGVCLHPGIVKKTALGRHAYNIKQMTPEYALNLPVLKAQGQRTLSEGAATQTYLSVAPAADLVPGGYYEPAEGKTLPILSSTHPIGDDLENAKLFLEQTRGLVADFV